MIGTTRIQLEVLWFITGFWEANYRRPTYREIASGVGRPNGGAVFDGVLALIERGRLDKYLRPVVAPTIPRAPDGAPLHMVRLQTAAV